MSYPTSTCRSCGAPIIWATTHTGKSMPVDPDPSPDGNVELTAGVDRPTAVVHSQPPLGVDELRFSHFVTCPDAGEWRAPRGNAVR